MEIRTNPRVSSLEKIQAEEVVLLPIYSSDQIGVVFNESNHSECRSEQRQKRDRDRD